MSKEFPHLSDTSFPGTSNIDVYKYKNNLDYSRFDSAQMTITVCNVPWDMGVVHVGNAQITGIGNVVYFDDAAARDEWFNDISESEKYVFETKFREFHANDEIKLPLPFDVAAQYNYIRIDYQPVPNAANPLQYEKTNGLLHWFYFIRSVESESPNTTVAHILRDTWQTYIYDVNISHMVLERGHAPVSVSNVDTYLSSPVDNNEWLLSPDVNYGEAVQVKHSESLVLNEGETYACICTTSNPQGYWGTKDGNDWSVAYANFLGNQGVPGVYVMAIPAANLETFFNNVDSQVPQFKQTVQGVFFASSKLLTIGDSFTFAGITCYGVSASPQSLSFFDITKDDFGYESRYSNLAKLYTYPYSYLEITDETGASVRVNVEDCGGSLTLETTLSLAFPWINISAYINGIGSSSTSTLNFVNMASHSFEYGGRWYGTLRSWAVPVFAIVQGNNYYNDYATHYDRAQQETSLTNTYNSSYANANNITDVAAVQVAASSSVTSTSNAASATDTSYSNELNQALQAWNAGYSRNAQAAEAEADTQTAAVSAVTGAIKSIGSGAMAGFAAGGPVGAAIGAAAGLAGAAVDGASTAATTAIAINLAATKVELTIGNTQSQVTETNSNNDDKNSLQQSTQTSLTDINNTATSGIAGLNSNVTKANADRGKNTSESAITNSVRQAGISAPHMFGSTANGTTATTRPQGLFASVITQPKGAIRQAGDYFLRFGYALNQAWDFTTFNLMPKFTYWKCSDIWVCGLNVPDAYMDEIRFFLLGGVTVWRNPSDIGRVSIYDNE